MQILKYFAVMFIVFWPVSAFPGMFGPSNVYECILDEMPGVKNDPAAVEVMRKCRKKFPNNPAVEKKTPVIGIKTAGECVLKYGKDVLSPKGAKYIQAACYRLYPR